MPGSLFALAPQHSGNCRPALFTQDDAQGAAMAAMMEGVGVLKTFPLYLRLNLIGINPVDANIILILGFRLS